MKFKLALCWKLPGFLSGNKLRTYLGAINKQFPTYKRIVLTKRCTIWADDVIIIFHMWVSDSFRDISDGRRAGTKSRPGNEISASAWNCEITGTPKANLYLSTYNLLGKTGSFYNL